MQLNGVDRDGRASARAQKEGQVRAHRGCYGRAGGLSDVAR